MKSRQKVLTLLCNLVILKLKFILSREIYWHLPIENFSSDIRYAGVKPFVLKMSGKCHI